MARKMFTFLGVAVYQPCTYEMGSFRSKERRFTSLAILDILQQQSGPWGPDDRLIVFATPKAKADNWDQTTRERKHGDKNVPYETLEAALTSGRETFPFKYEFRLIESEHATAAADQWKLFNQIAELIHDGDEVYFDISFGFRFLPVMASAIWTYVRTLRRDVKLGGVYYGAYEAGQSNAPDAQSNGQSKRIAPLVDITSMVRLGEWANAVTLFDRAGDLSMLEELTRETWKSVYGSPSMESGTVRQIRKIISELGNLVDALATCRMAAPTPPPSEKNADNKAHGRKDKSTFARVKNLADLFEELNQYAIPSDNELAPITSLFSKIGHLIEQLRTDDRVEHYWSAAQWCVGHNRIQQAYTFLLEGVVSKICIEALGEEKTNDEKARTLVTTLINHVNQKKEDGIASLSTKYSPDIWNPIYEYVMKLEKSIVGILDSLRSSRNDMMHGGMNDDPSDPEALKSKIKSFLEQLHPSYEYFKCPRSSSELSI